MVKKRRVPPNEQDQTGLQSSRQKGLGDKEENGEAEEPLPRPLIALFLVVLVCFAVVSAYFQMHPKDRFPEQWDRKQTEDGVAEDLLLPPDF